MKILHEIKDEIRMNITDGSDINRETLSLYEIKDLISTFF